MYHWTDDALILDVAKYGDHDAIVQLFTPQHGLARGIVKRGFSSKNRADIQPGTQAQVQWKARLPEHMGTVTIEGQHSFATRVMHDPLRLAAIGSICALIGHCMPERDPHPELYHDTVDFLKHVAAGVEPLIWLAEYVRLEVRLLRETGFGLDFSQCAATGATEELIYVSPKSGRSVSRLAGAPYHERMLPLPDFLHHDHMPDSLSEIAAGLTLSSHFIETQLLPALHRHPPALRVHFVALVERAVSA